jgi:rhodanese-related sulfurtransferase
MKTSILTIIAVLIFFSVKAQEQNSENLNSKQAWDLIQKFKSDTNFVVLDVRTPSEFAEGHIEKSILVDYKSADFENNITKLDKTKTYLVYCKGGGRSAKAIEIMKKHDFKNIYHLYLGLEVWKNKNLKISK